jgi:hypothetical protein
MHWRRDWIIMKSLKIKVEMKVRRTKITVPRLIWFFRQGLPRLLEEPTREILA